MSDRFDPDGSCELQLFTSQPGKKGESEPPESNEVVRPTEKNIVPLSSGSMLRRGYTEPVFAEKPSYIDSKTPLGGLITVAGKETRRVLGMMSGTSLDGIDLALVEISGHYPAIKVGLLHFDSYPFPADLRKQIFELITPWVPPKTRKEKRALIWWLIRQVMKEKLDLGHTRTLEMVTRLDFLLGEAFAGVINEFIRKNDILPGEIDLCATAGQTIWHSPELMEFFTDWPPYNISTRATFALGQSAVIADRTGICTIGDLRVRDVAAGGHGAPLIPYADFILLQDTELNRCIQNIGGIGNVTFIPAKPSGVERVIAFDTGPGNMIIDALTVIATDGLRKFDEDGLLASRGTVLRPLLEKMMAHPFILEAPPKSTGRETFGVQYAKRMIQDNPGASILDLIATATEFTIQSIAYGYKQFILGRGYRIHEVVVGGGGGNNPLIMQGLARELGIPVRSHEEIGFLSQAKEPMAMALIADAGARGLVGNVPGATGGRPVPLGKISLGR